MYKNGLKPYFIRDLRRFFDLFYECCIGFEGSKFPMAICD
nr:MAG TPA: hypothetical protein [Bacteriophage sp.]